MITYYVQRGMPKAERASFDLTEAIPWLLNNARVLASESVGEGTREELYAAQVTTHKLQHAQLRHQLVPYDEAAGVLFEVSQIIIGSMDGLAPRLGGLVANMDNPAEIEEAIEREIRGCREQAARHIREYESKHKNGSGDSQPAPAKKRRRVGQRKPNTTPRKPRAGAMAQ